MLLEDLAKELVPVTSELLGGRTLNVMTTSGIIIASTEKERIGTFHQGALEAVQTGRTVNITKEQVSRYAGAKEGCNMPLRLNGEIIGAVGIYGNPEEIAYLARMWEAYAAKAYQLEMLSNPQLEDAKIRSRIMRNLLYPREHSFEDAAAWMAERRIRLAPPLQVAVVSSEDGGPMTHPRVQEVMQELSGYLDDTGTIWSVEDDRLVILLGSPRRLTDAILSGQFRGCGYRFSVSGLAPSLFELQNAYRRAALLHDLSPQETMDASEPSAQALCMLAETAEKEEAPLSLLCKRAMDGLKPEEFILLLRTAACYYEEGRSVGRAAERLFVHKNTLQYRIRRLWEALGIEKQPDFEREYLIRLLFIRERRKQGGMP